MLSVGRLAKRLAQQEQKLSPEKAVQLMQQHRWPQAAQLWRRLIGETAKREYLIQYGHSLKEAGFFSDALSAYERAYNEDETDADLPLQLGHLAKVTGRFHDAVEWYKLALGAFGQQQERVIEIRRELANCRELIDRETAVDKLDSKIVFSSASGRLETLAEGRRFGTAHYSYAFAMRGFMQAADQLGLSWSYLDHPALWSNASDICTSNDVVHLRFSPPHLGRLLKGARNILCFAWEFPVFPLESDWAHAFSNPSHMMDIFDEIWVPSHYSAETVSRYTDRPVRVVASPIFSSSPNPNRAGRSPLARIKWVPLSILPRLQDHFDDYGVAQARTLEEIISRFDRDDPPTIYLTVANPHDKRKQLSPLLKGFIEHAASNPNCILLVKATSPDDTNHSINRRLVTSQLAMADELLEPLGSDRIWITANNLTDAQMDSLYRTSNFYLCTSFCEGQNLPLLEAMARGVVPVTVKHTAMDDYIRPDNALIIPHRSTTAPMHLQNTYRIWGENANAVSPADVVGALVNSASLSSESRSTLSRNASAIVAEQYNRTHFAAALVDLGIQLIRAPA